MEEKNNLTEYMGVYDHKESKTFRPTVESRIHKDSPVAKTMTCREDSCCVIERNKTHTHTHSNLRIRKLVPVETLKLMGFTRKDYAALRDIGQSDAQIYHESGDSIVTTVLASIFSSLFDNIDGVSKIEIYIEELVKEETQNGSRNNEKERKRTN